MQGPELRIYGNTDVSGHENNIVQFNTVILVQFS